MNPTRRVQIAATAAIASAALALGSALPFPARAGTCSSIPYNCVTKMQCVVSGYCRSHTPPGCSYVSSQCTLTPCDANGNVLLLCHYQ